MGRIDMSVRPSLVSALLAVSVLGVSRRRQTWTAHSLDYVSKVKPVRAQEAASRP